MAIEEPPLSRPASICHVERQPRHPRAAGRFLDFARNDTFSIGMAKLVIADTSHDLVEEIVTIGRAADNLIHIDDASVSGRHAELRQSGEDWHLRDVGSTNGTQVNGVAGSLNPFCAGGRDWVCCGAGCFGSGSKAGPAPVRGGGV